MYLLFQVSSAVCTRRIDEIICRFAVMVFWYSSIPDGIARLHYC